MKYLYIFAAVCWLSISSTVACAADYNFKPGLWEGTATTKIAGIPPELAQFMENVNNHTETETECVTDLEAILNARNECDVKHAEFIN